MIYDDRSVPVHISETPPPPREDSWKMVQMAHEQRVRGERLMAELVDEAKRRYFHDAVFHARVKMAVQVSESEDPELTAAVALLLGEKPLDFGT